MLVVIGVTAVLVGLLAPALRGARSGAGATTSLANLSGIGRSLEAYAQANRLRFPFPPRYPGAPSAEAGPQFGPVYSTPNPGPDDASLIFSPVFAMERNWPMVMHGAAPWEEHFASWLSPRREATMDAKQAMRLMPPNVSYHYGNSFVASARVWSGAREIVWNDVGPQQVSAVAHPSAKVVMYDADRAYLGMAARVTDARPLLFVDGSASLRLDTDARAPAINALTGSSRYYHDTANGILGADF